MIKNKYFILFLPNTALNAILEKCVQSESTVRKTTDGKKAVVKLPVGAKVPNILKNKKEYSHGEIRIELRKAEWNPIKEEE